VSNQGKIWLVGAGPGDPGLITVRGLELLRTADAVLYDALSHPALLAECRADADLRDVGKRGGKQSPNQDWITQQLVELGRAGKQVVRLKGGDSFLFARGGEEAQALAEAGVGFEVVPGLSSPVGTSAYAGIPLTHRELSSSVTFITGSDKDGREWSADAWRKLATATDTICVLMGMKRIGEIAEAIVQGGRSPETPVAVVQWGARPEQRVLTSTLATVAADVLARGFANPAVIVIGEVVSLRDELRWFDNKPLFSKRILVPRAEQQAGETARAIRERAAEPVLCPVIELLPPPDPARLSDAVGALDQYDWVLFTSSNGVQRFLAELTRQGKDVRAFGRARIGVIGPKTAEAIERAGLRPDLVAREFVGEALAEAVLAAAHGKRVLVARALVARDELPQMLGRAGYSVDVVPAYQTVPIAGQQRDQLRELLTTGAVDVMLFTSSSTVNHTCDALGSDAAALLSKITVASIGPVTSASLQARGVPVHVAASVYTVSGLLDALEAHFLTTRA
jgi:uroporphyrinogen III methyltransferase / synthase